MPLESGSRIGPYEIRDLIAVGGMGEVYRARDPRLARDVAVKVLRPQCVSDPDRLRRFEQESRAAGALSHPNIVTVFDSGLHEGAPYFVFELLRGVTLRDALLAGSLPVRRAIDLGAQLANGLAAAHEAAIVHRDLKPENVFVTADGRAKILDFGLAKLKPTPLGVSSDNSTTTMTDEGTIMGTVSYMSPEQAIGRSADARSDIFAFGTVFYEMLTGQKAFRRDSKVETLRAILKEEPPEIDLPNADTLPALRRIVGRCLDKSPEGRFQSARDLAFALETLSGISAPVTAVVARSTRHVPPWWVMAAVAALVAGIAAATLRFLPRRSASSGRIARVEKLTNRGNVDWGKISPDGRYLAYRVPDGRTRTIWLRDLVERTETRLVPAADDVDAVQFTPDSSALYYVVRRMAEPGTLYRVPVIGGEPRLVRNGSFDYRLSPDGRRLARDRQGAFLVSDVEGGQEAELKGARNLNWSSDGRQLLFARDREAGKSELIIAEGDGTRERKVADLEQRPDRLAWRPHEPTTACMLFEGHLALVDLRTGAVRSFGEGVGGKPIEVESVDWIPDGSGLVVWRRAGTSSMPDRRPWFVSYPDGRATPIAADSHAYWGRSMTSDGAKLVSTQITLSSDVVVSTSQGAVRQTVLVGTDVKYRARWTTDGRIVFSSNEAGTYDLYVCDADGSNRRSLTSDRTSDEIEPAQSPDGRYFVFVQDRAGRREIFRIDSDGTGLKRLTEADPSKAWVRDNEPIVTPDSRWVLYRHWDNGPALWRVPIDGGTPLLVRGSRPANPVELVYGASASPDGKSLAFLYFTMDYTKETGRTSATEVVVSDSMGRLLRRFPFLETTPGVQEDWRVQWSRDGRALYYVLPKEGSYDIWSQPIAGGPAIQVTRFDKPIQHFDWSADGKSIVISRGFTTSDIVQFTEFH